MGSSSLFCACIVALLFVVVSVESATNCALRTTCSSCTVDTQCGWCLKAGGAQCISGGIAKPDNCSIWQYSNSKVLDPVTPGFPVHPSSVDVFLKPGETVTVNVQVTPLEASAQKLDLIVVQDGSGSMEDDLKKFQELVPDLVNNVLAYRDDAWFGMTTFLEKPLAPAGKNSASDNNYVYKLRQGLTNDYNRLLLAVEDVIIYGNRDWCEAALDGMTFTIIDPASGWREDSKKVIVLATDACFHEAGDFERKKPYSDSGCSPAYDECCYDKSTAGYPGGKCPFSLPPNNLDMIMDVYNFTNTALRLPGTGEDYVSRKQWKDKMLQKNIVPIFAVTNTGASPQDEIGQYTELRDYLGFGAVYPLSSDSSNLVAAIITSLDDLQRTVTMAVATDQYNYVKSFTPESYKDVDQTQIVNFDVSLRADRAVVKNTIQLTVFGFGTVFINVLPALPCKGCDGVVNSNAFYDNCGVCAGNDSCLDCDRVPFGSKVKDICGKCGGDGSSCRGCDGEYFSNKTLDLCGVCDGKNACIGCDGVARPIPYVRDLCGVCNGNDSCVDCANEVNGPKKFDKCGVCGGNNECIGCDGKASVPPLAFDSCGVCGGNDSCYDCTNTINGTAKMDLCGVCNGNNSCRSCDGTYNPYDVKVNDSCGICGGDGSSCRGCDGISPSNKTLDRCGVCDGNNTCIGCDGVVDSGKQIDACGICGGDGTTCIGCDGVKWSNKTYDRCGICGGNNACVGCDGVLYSSKIRDQCGDCGGDGTRCIGCDGVLNSGLIKDDCGVCGGNNTCVGCDEVPNSGAVFDKCNVCNGDSSCLGCDGIPYSEVELDLCGVCPNAPNYVPNACVGCDGVINSGKKWDLCHVCDGNNTCVGCDGVPNSNLTLDECGVCPNAPNYTVNACFGCDGKPNSNLTFDQCNVCGGNSSSCTDCSGEKGGNKTIDRCGVCGGTNSCVGCDDIVNSPQVEDACGVCGGQGDSCLSGCDNKPFSNLTYDGCKVCGGDNSTCAKGKPFYLQTKTIAITAGTVGGVIVGVAALVAGLFMYKRLTAGAYWYIPKDLLDSTSSAVVENPLFDPKGEGFSENPIFDD